MIHVTSKDINAVTSRYFEEATCLFCTINFHNVSITSSIESSSQALTQSFDNLKEALHTLHKGTYDNFVQDILFKHMPSLCYSALVSAFEIFLIDISTLALKKHPQKISKENVEFRKVIELSKEEIIELKIKEYLNEIMYKAPKDYLKSLCDLLSVDNANIKDNFNKYIEIKARRDLGVHNNWIKNDIYIRKLHEAGIPEPASDKLLPSLDEFRSAFNTCGLLVQSFANESANNLFKVSFSVDFNP